MPCFRGVAAPKAVFERIFEGFSRAECHRFAAFAGVRPYREGLAGLKSRDGIPALLIGLQAIYKNEAARRKHSEAESAVNKLEHRGLNRVRVRGSDGFELAVDLSALAFNIHRVRMTLREKERERRRRKFAD